MKKTNLISHIVAGYPTEEIALEVVRSLVVSGATIFVVELPFTDSTADSQFLQIAFSKMLAKKYKTLDAFNFIEKIHKEFSNITIYLMSYASLIYTPGIDSFCKISSECGVKGIIVPDLPFDQNEGLTDSCNKYGMKNIPLVTSNMSDDRFAKLIKLEYKFVYCPLFLDTKSNIKKVDDKTFEFLKKLSAENIKTYCSLENYNSEILSSLEGLIEAIDSPSAFVKIIAEKKTDIKVLRDSIIEKANELNDL